MLGVQPATRGISRRRFLGYLIAGPTLVAGAQLGVQPASAAIPTHQPVDDYDLTDLLTQAAAPTSGLITITVNPDGTASFALPRAEVGQGITTAVAMRIADEMDLAIDQVQVTLASKAAVNESKPAIAKLKPQSQLKLVGTPQRRIDALDAVTGRKQFAMDLDLPGAVWLLPARADHGGGGARQRRQVSGRTITDDDLDQIRNVCRCGTYPRIREAITSAAGSM